jgi:hypothetical protein
MRTHPRSNIDDGNLQEKERRNPETCRRISPRIDLIGKLNIHLAQTRSRKR